MLSSTTRTFPPLGEEKGVNERSAWSVGGVRYEFVLVPAPRFFGITEIWADDRSRVPMFDRERALLDAFYHFHIFGSLSTALEILEARIADLEVHHLAHYAVRFGVAAVVKRAGWALERLGAAPAVLEPLLAFPGKGDSPLDPGLPARGRHDPRWHVIENLNTGCSGSQ